MKVLVTGVAGQLGYDVIKELESHQIEYLGVDRDTMDLTDENAVREVITNFGPTQIKTPVEGMLIYDQTDLCIKLYNGTTWHCIERSCNE